ncbi:MAG TPA: hypothetical protein P5075_01275 [Eubacteriales bacterium]|nr:hypothetical protein [Eubacteriales bacterium]
MRSIIDEIAKAEERAEEIRQNAAVKAREMTAGAKEEAEKALAALDAEERKKTESALKKAQETGEETAKETLAGMEREADELCAHAEERLEGAVRYLVDQVQSRA